MAEPTYAAAAAAAHSLTSLTQQGERERELENVFLRGVLGGEEKKKFSQIHN